MNREEPHSSAYEMAALALMLQHPESSGAVLRSSLSPETFYCAHHRALFEAIRDHHQDGDVAILDKAMRSRAYQANGGPDLFDKLKSTKVSEKKSDEVRSKLSEFLACRKMIEMGPKIVESAYSGELAVANAELGSMMDVLSRTVKHESRGGHIKDCLNEVADEILEMTKGKTICKPVGLPKLDALTGGLVNELIMIAGPTSSGKSALMKQFMLSNCRDHKRPGIIFSYELQRKVVTKRLLAFLSGISLGKLMGITPDGSSIKFRRDELLSLKRAAEELSSYDLFIEDDVTLTIEDIWARCTEMKAVKGDLGCVAIDYAQILPSSPHTTKETRERQVSHIGIKSKQLNMHLNCPVLLLSQLSQDFTARESKALEQHAGNLYKVVRGEDPRTGQVITDEHILIWKNRMGPRFEKIGVFFDGERQKFTER